MCRGSTRPYDQIVSENVLLLSIDSALPSSDVVSAAVARSAAEFGLEVESYGPDQAHVRVSVDEVETWLMRPISSDLDVVVQVGFATASQPTPCRVSCRNRFGTPRFYTEVDVEYLYSIIGHAVREFLSLVGRSQLMVTAFDINERRHILVGLLERAVAVVGGSTSRSGRQVYATRWLTDFDSSFLLYRLRVPSRSRRPSAQRRSKLQRFLVERRRKV